MSEIKIGDTLWTNRDHGRSAWISGEIVGETRMSWLVKVVAWGEPSKVSKKELLESDRRGKTRWFTEAGKEDYIWARQHRYEIERRVNFATAAQLRQIADILGYKP